MSQRLLHNQTEPVLSLGAPPSMRQSSWLHTPEEDPNVACTYFQTEKICTRGSTMKMFGFGGKLVSEKKLVRTRQMSAQRSYLSVCFVVVYQPFSRTGCNIVNRTVPTDSLQIVNPVSWSLVETDVVC